MITIIGLGPGPYDLLTLRAARALEEASLVLLRTARHPIVAEFPASVRWVSFDDLYDAATDFVGVYQQIVECVLARTAAGDIVYAVPGDPCLGEETVRLLVEQAPIRGQTVRLVAGVSFLSPVVGAGPGAISGHLQLMDALDPIELNPLVPTVVYQVHNRTAASSIKLHLLRTYPPEHRVLVVNGDRPNTAVKALQLAEIDRADDFDHLTSLYVPALVPEQALASPHGLRQLVHRLRAPGGCPWDREQTHASLLRYLLEETYEVADAISDGDPHALREELGDLLLQVYLQAELAEESGDFDLTDVTRGISEKLVRRHPHVFAGLQVSGADEVAANWERLKLAEKRQPGSTLDRISRSLPALSRAQEIQRKLSQAGFDWSSDEGVWAKLEEEIAELRAARSVRERTAELGDVLFMLAKLGSNVGVDAEAALRGACLRVTRRFRHVEASAAERGLTVSQLCQAEQLLLWAEAKRGGERPGGAGETAD